jgi:hypothetical protein
VIPLDGRPQPTRGGILLTALIAILVAACSLLDRPPEILDGLSVGGPASCGACDTPQTAVGCDPCDSIAVLARRHLDETFPGHPEVAAMSFHGESWYPGPSGERILHTRSGSIVVAVATFVDGTRHAVFVYCGVGGCR